ncbi:NUDIX domain-containing protein [Metamycoplasma neophronis]|uniref:NUDIX domain-containing protein n=1 Tax=Metamycoplasma neophronis TaxID=872983 RepID=A0ABY2Z4H4_9BACT|nr:NUDIX domain-containing protein [Metamycoplasma neophronis]TPR53897.1 NUDIX domain-containing protein [Metamycoplasma neophronis]
MKKQANLDKLLFSSSRINVYETEQGIIYAQRRNKDSIAALCYRKNADGSKDYLIRFQPLIQLEENQAWNKLFPCPITGSFEENETPLNVALREVFEEAGYKITEKNLVNTFKFFATTQMNETVYGFIFDITNMNNTEPETDGSLMEKISKNVWMSLQEVKKICENNNNLASLPLLFYLDNK